MGAFSKLWSKIKNQYSFSKEGLSFKEKFYLALPGPAGSLSSVLIHNVYIKLYTDVIKLDPMYVGMVYFWFNIWNTINDPIFGVFIDKMKYKPGRGKFLYLMRVTVPFIILCLASMLFANPEWPQKVIYYVLLGELFLFDTAFTLFSIANNCYFLIAAPTKEERVDVNILRGYIANIVSFFATLVPSFLLVGNRDNNRMQIIMILMGVIALNAVVYFVALFNLKETPEMYKAGGSEAIGINLASLWEDVKSILSMKAFWAWFFYGITALAPSGIYFTAFLYYMDHVIRADGLQTTITDVFPMLFVFAVYPVLGNIVKRYGGKKAIFAGMIPYMAGYALLFFAQTWWQALISYIPIMTGKYLAETGAAPLGAAIIDENEMLTGTRKTGLFGAVNAILAAPVSGIQLIIFMGLLKRFGYDEHAAVQSAEAMLGIRIATALVPIIFCLIGMIPLKLFPYDKEKEQELSRFSASRRRGNGAGKEDLPVST
ncbi:MAG: MFS transporter [Clostridia bacterium]|nr:MFS transporter [Clostridia bacterium]